MNPRQVRYSCFVVCMSVLLGSSWSAPAAAGDAAGLRLAAGPISGGAGNPPLPPPPLPAPVGPGGKPLPLYNPPPQITEQERAEAAAKSKGPTFDPNKAPDPPPPTVLMEFQFELGSTPENWGNHPGGFFIVPGPGQVILQATTLEPQKQLDITARQCEKAPNGTLKWTDIRKDGPTPLRLDVTETVQNPADRCQWVAIVDIVGLNGVPYETPPSGARGHLTVSFIPQSPAQKIPVPGAQKNLVPGKPRKLPGQ